MDKPVTTT